MLARVRHNNVVTIHGAEQIGDRSASGWSSCAATRSSSCCRTADRSRRITRRGSVVDLCHAVSAVHAAGLLHRDIKAHNVMLGHDGRVVLMDFGTGRELNDAVDLRSGGTPLYVAPEVLDGQPATAQSDVYSLGVLLFHLLTGSYPVQGQTIGEIRAAHAARSTSRLRGLRPGVPTRIARRSNEHSTRSGQSGMPAQRPLMACFGNRAARDGRRFLLAESLQPPCSGRGVLGAPVAAPHRQCRPRSPCCPLRTGARLPTARISQTD